MGEITKFSGSGGPLSMPGDGGVVSAKSRRSSLRDRLYEYGRGLSPDLQRTGVSIDELRHELGLREDGAKGVSQTLLMESLMTSGWRLRRGEAHLGQSPLVLVPPWAVDPTSDVLWTEVFFLYSDSELEEAMQNHHVHLSATR